MTKEARLITAELPLVARITQPTPPPASDYLTWVGRTAANHWLLINLLGIVIVVAGLGQGPRIFTWAVFLGANSLAYHGYTTRAAHVGGSWLDRAALEVGFAGIYGLAWAAAAYLATSMTSAPVAYAAYGLTFAVVLSGLPIFAARGTAYAGLLASYLVPVGYLLYSRDGMLAAATAVTVATVIAVLSAEFQRRLTAGVANVVDETNALQVQLAANRLALTIDSTGFLDGIRSQVGALKHAFADVARTTATLDALSDGVIRVDGEGRVEYLNPAAENMTGYPLPTARGKSFTSVLRLQVPGSQTVAAAALERCFKCDSPPRDHATLHRRDGVRLGVDYVVTPLHSAASREGAVFLLRDTAERRNAARTLAWETTHDPLTGLINRSEFEVQIKTALTKPGVKPDEQHALCVVGIDHFTFINDNHGAAAGDYVLQTLALTLGQRIRGVDVLARLDGNAFGILLVSCPMEKARVIAEGIRAIIAEMSLFWQGTQFSIHASLSLTSLVPPPTNIGDVLSAAERVCACTARNGGNRLEIIGANAARPFAPTQPGPRLIKNSTALHYEHFELFFQTLIPIGTEDDSLSYCEVKLQPRADNSALFAPRELPATTGHHPHLPEIDRWLVKAAVEAIKSEHAELAGMDVVGIGVSAQSVADEQFVDYTVRLIDDAAIVPAILCFEILESPTSASWERVSFFVATMKDLGCKVALGDFGRGAYSYQILKRSAVDYLIIHDEFVRNIAYNSVDYEIVLGIARVAKSLRVRTIAGGVPNLATRDMLRGMGVDYAQGLLLEKPRPLNVRHLH
ncbi:MAG: EAL domain-containing protein [Gammaproteobacteria bacterium]|nr:EAL domain-containing protein [Gammaproteobacteria bacterium]